MIYYWRWIANEGLLIACLIPIIVSIPLTWWLHITVHGKLPKKSKIFLAFILLLIANATIGILMAKGLHESYYDDSWGMRSAYLAFAFILSGFVQVLTTMVFMKRKFGKVLFINLSIIAVFILIYSIYIFLMQVLL